MQKIVKFVVLPAALAGFVHLSAFGEDTEAPLVPFVILAEVEGRHDSDASDSDNDPFGIDTIGLLDLRLNGEIGGRWKTDSNLIEIAGGLAAWKTEFGENSSELGTFEAYLRGDFDLPVEIPRIERLTAGFEVSTWWSRVGGRSFADSRTLTLALQGTWQVTTDCNFDNVLLFAKFSDLDDGPVSDPALSRDGDHKSYGAEANFYMYGTDDDKTNCRRPGILRRYVPSGVASLAVGYRVDELDAIGEYEGTSNQLYLDSRFPLQRNEEGDPVSSLDLSMGVAKVDYDNPSIFPPFDAREDMPSYFEAAYVRHLKNLDVRAGFRSQTNASSNIPQYQYERNYVFVGLKYELFRDSDSGTGDTGSDGSSSDRRTGQSGSSGAVNPGLNP